ESEVKMKLTIQHRAELKKIRWQGAGFSSIRKGKKSFARKVSDAKKSAKKEKEPGYMAKWFDSLFA
ncbi:hypothetical protein, partial [Staphylococcus aureus]